MSTPGERMAACQHEMTAEYVKVRLNDGYFCEKCGALMAFVPADRAALLDRMAEALREARRHIHEEPIDLAYLDRILDRVLIAEYDRLKEGAPR